MRRREIQRCILPSLAALGCIALALWAPGAHASARTNEDLEITIPRMERAPTLDDFLGMEPSEEVAGQMLKVEGFIQQEPSDGSPASQRTEVYLGYDAENFYAVFLAFDTEPGKIRARMAPRESVFGDDQVEIMLDTFHDLRHAYVFSANPLGIQRDAFFTEGGGGGRGGGFRGFDTSFDTLWYSRGKLTDEGFMVWMAIPFKSLRFPGSAGQRWGIILNREIPRTNENLFWPRVTSRIQGRMNQAADLLGLEDLSEGRNIQLIPYGAFSSSRALDQRDENFPRFVQEDGKFDGGLDAKFIFRDSLVLDIAINPDFSQVESDQPQVTTNQRFEVFFPERRPFFLENASFFQTPINLVFTRRIADPQFGVRLTGKVGPNSMGAMVIDDQSPGRRVLPGDPDHGKRAYFGLFRYNRDLWSQSTIGAIYTQRQFLDTYNRTGGVDGRLKFGENWSTTFQAITSASRDSDGLTEAGPAYSTGVRRQGRTFEYSLNYNDIGQGFGTETGFVRRTGIRSIRQNVEYNFRPEGKYLISWGPRVSTDRVYDRNGLRLDFAQDTFLSWRFKGQTSFTLFYTYDHERIVTEDSCGESLLANQDFTRTRRGIRFNTRYFSSFSVRGNFSRGTRINCVPPDIQPPPPAPGEPASDPLSGLPVLADLTSGDLNITVRPVPQLRIDNSYILSQLTSRQIDTGIFTNHIVRSRWNWQFSRELSLRFILQYNSVLANPLTTRLDTRKNVNADFLFTYLLHPGTVLFIGYNSNLQNIDLVPGIDPDTGEDIVEIARPRNRYINDGRGLFVKFSYLYRF